MQPPAHLAVFSRHHGGLSYKLEQGYHWSIEKKGGTCFLCSIVCLLPFLPTSSILKAKIEECRYNVVAFCAGPRLDRGAKERTYGRL